MSTATKRVDDGTPIAKSNRFFMKVTQYGHLDEKGRVLMGVGLSGRIEAAPDKPLSTLGYALLVTIAETARYSSDNAMRADLDRLRADLAEWMVTPKKSTQRKAKK